MRALIPALFALAFAACATPPTETTTPPAQAIHLSGTHWRRVDDTNAKSRMSDIDRFTSAFPNSRFDEPIASYAMMSLTELKDTARVVAYGEKALAANPNNLPALLLLAGTYVEDPKPGGVAKAVNYAQKAVAAAKADAPDADRTHKLSGGVAHSTLGYAYMKQEKTVPAIAELKSAASFKSSSGPML